MQSVFLKIVLTVLTAHWAIPFDLGYSRLDVTLVNSHFVARCLNSKLENCGALSDTTIIHGNIFFDGLSLRAIGITLKLVSNF